MQNYKLECEVCGCTLEESEIIEMEERSKGCGELGCPYDYDDFKPLNFHDVQRGEDKDEDKQSGEEGDR